MTHPWVDNHNNNSGDPCMHALVIGVSFYKNLPMNPGDPIPNDGRVTLGLGQLTSPASSAFAFAKWLKYNYFNPGVPLGSIRLLLSPSDLEKANNNELDRIAINVPRANSNNVEAALWAWKADCEKNRNNVAVFYVAGHGHRISKDDSIVLLEDFAEPNRPVLKNAMDIGRIWHGMSNGKAAKNQFYFVDACRNKPDVFKQYENTPVGVTLDSFDNGTANVAPIYYSASPDGYALGYPGRMTLFCKAFLDCLKLHGVKEPDHQNRWTITTTSLVRSLPDRVEKLASAHNENQDVVVGGLIKEEIFHVLQKPPKVPLSVSLRPQSAYPYACAKLWDGMSNRVIFNNAQFTPILRRKVPGGTYVLSVTFPPGTTSYKDQPTIPVPVLPPERHQEVLV